MWAICGSVGTAAAGAVAGACAAKASAAVTTTAAVAAAIVRSIVESFRVGRAGWPVTPIGRGAGRKVPELLGRLLEGGDDGVGHAVAAPALEGKHAGERRPEVLLQRLLH